MGDSECSEFEPQRFKPNACKKCYRHKDNHTSIEKVDPLEEVGSKLSLLKNQSVVGRFEKHVVQEHEKKQNTIESSKYRPEAKDEDKLFMPSPGIVSNRANVLFDAKNNSKSVVSSKQISIDDIKKEALAVQQQIEEERQKVLDAKKRKEEEEERLKKAKKAEEEERKRKAEEEKIQEMKQREEDKVERIAAGVARDIAEGDTMDERKALSHTTSRGIWVLKDTHFGVPQGSWVGCCKSTVQYSWCLRYRGVLIKEDLKDREEAIRADQLLEKQIYERTQKGMPEIIASGKTKIRRQHLSHTLNKCRGISTCDGKCKGKYENEIWTCCRSPRHNSWCLNYEGPQL